MSDTNNKNERLINNLNGTFTIEKYQRGYKWTPIQVIDLLEDINKNATNENHYCLQPLAVKKISDNHYDNHYEVIDGQQRLTTIYLILKILDKKNLFNIEYNTRNRSKNFLEEINIIINDNTLEVKNIDEQWKRFVENNKKNNYDNIDNYHFFSAYLTIKEWFKNKKDEKDTFKKKLLDYTFFIWYDDSTKKSPEEIFRNLNSGKIPLTNAELIKALFIVEKYTNKNKELQELQRNTFAREWDMIEQDLQDDSFWFFINNDTNKNRYQTRIDFLFELVTGKSDSKHKDYLHSYKQYADSKVDLDWKQIKNYYLILKEWYDDKEIYHLVGYIVTKQKSIKELIDLEKEKTKTQFKKELIDLIEKDLFKNTDDIETFLKELNFHENRNEIHKVLLLFNIAEYHKIYGLKFPFYKYKNTKWSLEHIFAQNARKFETKEELNAWKNEAEKVANDIKTENRNEIINKIKDINLPDNDEDFKNRKKEIIEKLQPIIDFFDSELHNISNMALLDGPTNSGLGNSPFPDKRKYIIDNLYNNFIPLATLNVFQKYYTKKIEQMEFWGQKDRDDYIDAIINSINNFLTLKNQ